MVVLLFVKNAKLALQSFCSGVPQEGQLPLCWGWRWERAMQSCMSAQQCILALPLQPQDVTGGGMLREGHEMVIKWGNLMHNSWGEANLCTRQDHPLNCTSMDHCLLIPCKIVSLHTVWIGAVPVFLTLFWNNTPIFLLAASRQFGLQSSINPYFFF